MSQINHPPHYGGDTTYEAIKVIEAWKLGFNLGNTVKYISRAELKGKPVQDLEKALWYLAREVRTRGGNVYQAIPTPEGEILVAVRLALEYLKDWETEKATNDQAWDTLAVVQKILNDIVERVTPTITQSEKAKA